MKASEARKISEQNISHITNNFIKSVECGIKQSCKIGHKSFSADMSDLVDFKVVKKYFKELGYWVDCCYFKLIIRW